MATTAGHTNTINTISEQLESFNRDEIMFENGELLVYNEYEDHYEIFDDVRSLINSAIWHRQFQRHI